MSGNWQPHFRSRFLRHRAPGWRQRWNSILRDGRASLVVGTHTHVPTADAQILPGGTAYQTDAGGCCDYDSVIGNDKEEPLRRFTTRISSGRYKPVSGPATVCGVFVETDPATGLARRIEPIRVGGRLSQHVPVVERVEA